MRVLTISNNKGGVGKTTLTIHLASALARAGKSVLVIDADPQATLTRWCLGREPERGLSQLLAEDYGSGPLVSDVIVETSEPNLRLLPTGQGLEATYVQMQGLAVNRLRDALDDLSAPVDLVLIDSPPRLGSVAEALLVAADAVLYSVDGGSESLVALQKLGRTVARVQKYRPSLNVLGIVVTRSQRNATHRLVEQTLSELYGSAAVRDGIPESAFVLQATLKRSTVFDLAERNSMARGCAAAYLRVAISVAEAMGL